MCSWQQRAIARHFSMNAGKWFEAAEQKWLWKDRERENDPLALWALRWTARKNWGCSLKAAGAINCNNQDSVLHRTAAHKPFPISYVRNVRPKHTTLYKLTEGLWAVWKCHQMFASHLFFFGLFLKSYHQVEDGEWLTHFLIKTGSALQTKTELFSTVTAIRFQLEFPIRFKFLALLLSIFNYGPATSDYFHNPNPSKSTDEFSDC